MITVDFVNCLAVLCSIILSRMTNTHALFAQWQHWFIFQQLYLCLVYSLLFETLVLVGANKIYSFPTNAKSRDALS
jgi:hypothetical protein